MDIDENRAPTDALLDILVYAPIGLLLDAQTVAPDLARRGRQHSAAARQIGEMAVKRGMRRLDELLAQVNDEESDHEVQQAADTTPVEPTKKSVAANPPAAGLAIPDYDLLAASHVVKRLDALDESELEAVRLYEAGTRDRRTILHKIARLQG